MNIRATFAANLRSLRKAAKLSQEKLAEHAGLHRTYIGGIEQQRVNVSLKNIGKIADALDVDPAALFASAADDTKDAWKYAAEHSEAIMERMRETPPKCAAIATWNDKGIDFHPISTGYEDLTIQVLVNLIQQGYTGDNLARQYDIVSDEITHFLEDRRLKAEPTK